MINFFKILVFVFLLYSGNVFGQHLVGFNAYYLQSKIAGDSAGINKVMYSEPGYGYGISYKHMELRNIIGFQGEINFQQSGFRILLPEDAYLWTSDKNPKDEPLYFKQKLQYVNVPVFMHLDFGQHTVKAIFAIGTYANFLLNKSKPQTNIVNFDSTGIDRIVNGQYKTFSYGLTGQAGFAICTKAGVVQLSARASVGMSKMIKMDDIALLNYITERSFGFGVSYFKPFGKEPYYTKKEKVKKEEKLEKEKDEQKENVQDSLNQENNEEVTPKEETKTNPNEPTQEDLDWEKRFDE